MIRNFLRNLMVGRYGPDHLNIAMIVVSLILYAIRGIARFLFFFSGTVSLAPLAFVSYALTAMALFRMMSRNITRRRAENDKFIRYWWPVRTSIIRVWANLKHRKTHRFLKCPGCGNILRIPKRKGKLQITCPKCGERFMRKT